LCASAFCSGFLGLYTHLSWIWEVYSGWEETSFLPAGRRELTGRRTEVLTRGAHSGLMLSHVEVVYTPGLGTGRIYHPGYTGRHSREYPPPRVYL